MTLDQTVRDAALTLKAAIADAVAGGYRVEWPSRVHDLERIAVSETVKVKPAEITPSPGVSHEDQGTGFDSGASGYELQGRRTKL